ncbi:2-oxoacid:acceptor oxidoreductase family protein [Streptomyces umbrinus]|uniref:2-oxoacid:acceptor oxidoreductase family protein n=1 Tax=Streptomyces umbrinus TaxID=67370 RepID=UPI0033ECC769
MVARSAPGAGPFRGGQGVVTGAELPSVAAFLEGGHAQAFPGSGPEGTGAQVVAFCRIGKHPIRVREQAGSRCRGDPGRDAAPANVFDRLRSDASVLVDSPRSVEELGLSDLLAVRTSGRVLTVPATALALAHFGRPVRSRWAGGRYGRGRGLMVDLPSDGPPRGRSRGGRRPTYGSVRRRTAVQPP